MRVFYIFALRCPTLKRGVALTGNWLVVFQVKCQSTKYSVLFTDIYFLPNIHKNSNLRRYIFVCLMFWNRIYRYITLVHNWATTAEVERMHVFYIFALRCPALKKGCCGVALTGNWLVVFQVKWPSTKYSVLFTDIYIYICIYQTYLYT